MKALIWIALLAASSAHAQGCFGPVVAGECHDAQSEMRRMQESQRQHEAQVRQSQERRTRRDLEARIAELEVQNAELRAALDELMKLLQKP